MRESTEFDRIFRLYYEPLYRFALQYVDDAEECHDIVSGAYEEVWRDFDQMVADTIQALLYTKVRNKCIDHLRRQQRQQQYVEFVLHTSHPHSANGHQLEQQDQARLMSQVLDQMESPTRDILEACYVHDKRYQEVAQEMGISVSTVKKHMVKALKMIRELKKKLKP